MTFRVDVDESMHKTAPKIEEWPNTCLGCSNICYFEGPKRRSTAGKNAPNRRERNGKTTK